jgi:VWFA-related protein
MALANKNSGWIQAALGLVAAFAFSSFLFGQTTSTPAQSQPAAQPQSSQEIPDAPSAVQPPPTHTEPAKSSSEALPPPPGADTKYTGGFEEPAPAPQPPLPANDAPPTSANIPHQSAANKQQLYTLSTNVNFVQVPVMVKDTEGRRVDGLLPKDFTVMEDGKKQTMSFELSVALVVDIGMPDAAVQKVNQTFPALVGAFSPYDEVALYTYSSTVSQVSDFNGAGNRLTAVLNQMKTVRGHNNGPPVLGGPFGPQGPSVNGVPVGGGPVAPVQTAPRESHVLNDAILRAALDLSKRERTRRKVIFVISDGRELGSKASYGDVLKLLLAQGIQVKAVAVEGAAIPLYSKLEKLHLPDQGYSNILPKYSSATGGGQIFTELSRNAIEEAYAQITSEARNQYTLGYTTRATASTAYRNIEVLVNRPGLKIYAKDGYYPIARAR